MHPILFEVAGFRVGTYALLALLGLVAGALLLGWLAHRRGRDPVIVVELALWAFVFALLGAKLFGAALSFDPDNPGRAFQQLLRSSGYWYAGLLVGGAVALIGFRRRGIPVLEGLDMLAPAVALAHAFGRVGCFLVGCCWGTACDLPWAVTFTSDDAHLLSGVPLGVPLHPVQIYEALAELGIAVVLVLIHARSAATLGRTFFAYLALYGTLRLSLEYLRADPRGVWFGVAPSQVLAGASIVAGVVGLAWTVMAARRSVAAG